MQSENNLMASSKVHFTYKYDFDKESLCQGDILKKTDALCAILKEVHPYFLNDQYQYFMVLTQSCDLVRRNNGKCKTPYITLAAVRSFNEFFEQLLIEGKYVEQVNGLLLMDTKNKERAYQLLERIYNNTESDYFFLYKDDALNFPESMITSLKVSIALKSLLHYDSCLEAKIIELSDEFKAKLGWLMGNIYSRVGTTDWESIMSAQSRKDMLNAELSGHCVIATKPQLSKLKQEIKNHKEGIKTSEDAIDFLSNCEVETKYDQVISELEKIIQSSSKKIPLEEKENLLKAIKSRNKLKTLLN